MDDGLSVEYDLTVVRELLVVDVLIVCSLSSRRRLYYAPRVRVILVSCFSSTQ